MSTALVTGHVEDSIDLADFDMKTAGIRHLLVVDNSNCLAGIVSDRDILRAFGAMGNGSLILGAVMSTNIMTIGENEPASRALEIMLERKISCLPVDGNDGQLVGVVTETDFMKLLHAELASNA